MPHRCWHTLLLRAGGAICLWLALAGWPGAASTAQATPAGAITVTSLADSSGGPKCTLRDAITAANTDAAAGGCPKGSPGPDTITFSLFPSCGIVVCVIDLGSPLPTITDDLTISGAGGTVILSGGGATRLLNVALGVTLHLQYLTLEDANSGANDGGAISNHGNLWLENSTIQNSHTDAGHSGGAIFTNRPVTLTDSLLQFNKGGSGGALFANFSNAVVTISNTTFLQNQAVNTTTTGYGGAIWIGSQAQVSIEGGAILSNTAQDGGGIYLSPGAAVTLTASGPPATMSGNTANGYGGGLDNEQGTAILTNVALSGNTSSDGGGIKNDIGAITLTNATFSGNSTTPPNGGGGGLRNDVGTATLVNVTFSGNSAEDGGGLINADHGTATLTNATFSGNSATAAGGGIENLGGAITLTNSTLSGNSVQGTLPYGGGGLYNDEGTATLTNVTLDGNSASVGGELSQNGSQVTQTITVLNTIVGPSASGANCFIVALSVVSPKSGGYNLSSDGSCAPYFNQPGDLNNANPNLGPLADNGGPTLTQMPQEPSPAIDTIPPGTNGCGTTLTTDQRGVPRPINGKCDIGAVEYGTLLTSLSPNSVAAGSAAFTLTVNGAGFVPGSRVRWDGSDRPTTMVDSTRLSAAISAADVAAVGSAAVTVFTPAPGGGTSNLIDLNVYARAGQDARADTEQGQPDFASTAANNPLMPAANGLEAPAGVAVDGRTGRLFVADSNNNRVLSWANARAQANGQQADLVLGQPDFNSTIANHGGRSATSLSLPYGLAVDGQGDLYVADALNSRVLEYDAPLSSDMAASRVFGQGGSFTTGVANNGGVSANSLYAATAVAVDARGNLYVGDTGNSRVLEYDTPLTTDTTADRVFGQPDMMSSSSNNGGVSPHSLDAAFGVAVDAQGHLYVADSSNNRVLEYDAPLVSGSAEHVFGQPSLITDTANTGGLSASSLDNPVGVATDGQGHLYVADAGNNRLLEYDAPLTGGRTADRVFGQPSMITGTANTGGVSALRLNFPTAAALDAQGNLYMADNNNNRVLEFDRPLPLPELFLPLLFR